MAPFTGFDLTDFWDDSDYARKELVEPAPADDVVASIEAELGYKLPEAYVALSRVQNGGMPVRTCFRTNQPTSWAEDHIAINDIAAIGSTKPWSLCGQLGSKFHVSDWEYPPIGVYFGNCPSAGHDLVALDYRECGPLGEPSVVHVDQEDDYRITYLAPDFETFVRGLEPDEAFPIGEMDTSGVVSAWLDESIFGPTRDKKPWWRFW